MFGSHKFFYLPFTHFYGYLHFTVRVQETWKRCQWDSHDIARFRKNRGIDISDLEKSEKIDKKTVWVYKYRGKLVPELQKDVLRELTEAQLNKTKSRRKGGEPGPAGEEAPAQDV